MVDSTEVRSQIERLEKALIEKQARLAELRRQLPPETVEDHVLIGPENREVRLSALFGDKDDLIVIHNMGRSCPYCTLWADGFNGMLPHFEDRAAFTLVSPDAPAVQQELAEERGWRFRMLSNGNSGFTEAMGYVREGNGKMIVWPGFSTFHRQPDGSIVRIAHASFGPGDPYCGIWHLFALLVGGVGDWAPRLSYR